MDGWLKLYRSIVDSAVFEDAEVLKIWIWLLCNVAYDEHDTIYCGKVIHLQKGQIATGRKKIAQSANMSESKVYRALKLLQKLGNIDIKVNSKYSLITVEKWAFFQADETKVNSKTTAKQQQNDSRTTAEQQQNNTTKERKERKERKEYISAHSGERTEKENSFDIELAKQQARDRTRDIGNKKNKRHKETSFDIDLAKEKEQDISNINFGTKKRKTIKNQTEGDLK